MKTMNFIQNISPADRTSIHTWFVSSCLLTSITIIILSIIYGYQYYAYTEIYKDYTRLQTKQKQLSDVLGEKRKLKEKEALLKKHLTKITRIKQKPKNPTDIIHFFAENSSSEITLQTIHIQKEKVTIQLYGKTTTELLAYLDHLQKTNIFKQVETHAIEPTRDQIKLTIDAIVAY